MPITVPGSSQIISGGTDNYVMTAVDANSIQGEANLTFDGNDLTLADDVGIIFGDAGEKIEGDGTDLTITGNAINLTASEGVYLGLAAKDIQANFRSLFIDNMSLNVDSNSASSGAYMGNNVYRDDGNDRWEYIIADQASQYVQYDGIHLWRTATAGSADAAITWIPTMAIDASGNLDLQGNSSWGLLNVGASGNNWTSDALIITGAGEKTLTLEATDNTSTILALDGDRSSQNNALGQLRFNWNNNRVAEIHGLAGPNDTNKNDGKLSFLTAPDGGTIAARMKILETGEIDFQSNALGITNVGASGNDWTATHLQHKGSVESKFERTTAGTAGIVNAFAVQTTSNGDISDGFGAEIRFLVEDTGVSDQQLGAVGFRRAGADNTGDFRVQNMVGGSGNETLKLTSVGVLSVDLAGSGTAAQVDLFDGYDDPMELQRFTHMQSEQFTNAEERQISLDRMVDMGVVSEVPGASSGYHMNLQPMVRLLAGGIYQNRERMDAQNEAMDARLKRIEQALGV